VRNFRSLSLALAGLVGLSASSATAGIGGLDTTNAGQPRMKLVKHKAKKTGHICPDCQAKMVAESGAPAPIMISGTPSAMMAAGPCTACETSGPAMLVPTAPGYASVGDGSPAPVMASAGDVPGYANVGGMVVSSEPAPIGVVRTNYAMQPEVGTSAAHPADAMMHGGAPTPNGPIPYAKPNEIPAGMLGGPPRRPRIFSRIIGLPDFGRARAESQARSRESHAMTSYGNTGAVPSNLPASMVYGK